MAKSRAQAPLFLLYLPIQRSSASEWTAGSDGRPATILVVEDELLVRQLACSLLREEGYTVLEASDGASALALASRHAGSIDLLLTDVTMPHMGGVELARELSRLLPALVVLYMSGHSEESLLRQGLARREAHFLAKPFSGAVLASTVKRMLQSAAVKRSVSA
jgi:CheY-like chemotaxis protein